MDSPVFFCGPRLPAQHGFGAETPNLQIPEDKFIRILIRDTGERIKGRFHEAIKDSLVMTRAKGILGRKQRLSIAFSDISKLEVHKYHKSYAKKGGIIGAFTGAIVGIALSKTDSGDSTEGLGGLLFSSFHLCLLWEVAYAVPSSAGLTSHHVWQEIDLSPKNQIGIRGDRRLSFQLSFRF